MRKPKSQRDEGATPASGVEMLPLSARYDEAEHKQYLDRLLAVLDGDDTSVRNVALTGRYGAGKSSVLTQLRKVRGDRVLFLSLSTMGGVKQAAPTVADADADANAAAAKAAQTNDIEKELVKQLLHREPAHQLPLSRYHRISSPGLARAVKAAAVQVAVIAAVLWMLGMFPDIRGLSGESSWSGWRRGAAGAGAFALATAVLTWVRLAVYDKAISTISAGGASISLSEKNTTESYFDRYLDEIVYYFQQFKRVDIVVFEDLDRFDNPQIFEELRELNELLNNSKEMGRTIRFVYALKDSIFEKLGHDTTTEELDDDAKAEVVRANRTKFFDLVIPMVPFITPRTSRSLLKKLLEREPAPLPVGAEARDLVAKHITDMRLLTNIRNEYALFSERLITGGKGAPALRPESLFALMVYKNIQLSDYEDLLLGRSGLDRLYADYIDILTEMLRDKRWRLRELDDALTLTRALPERSATYGSRLHWLIPTLVSAMTIYGKDGSFNEVTLGGSTFDADGLNTEAFWRELVTDQGDITASFSVPRYGTAAVTLTFAQVCEFLGEDLSIGAWDEHAMSAVADERRRLESDIALLQRADFEDLVARPDFTRSADGVPETFETALLRSVKSQVCRDLVRHGHIDQNFAVYVSQFYGDLVTVRAMNYVFQHVQRDKAHFDYDFAHDDDIAGVFDEVGYDFLDQVSGYNIAILDYLMRTNRDQAVRTIDRVTRLGGKYDLEFLDTYLTEGRQALDVVAVLASEWTATFTHLTSTPGLQDERRHELVNQALRHADDQVRYDIDDRVREYLRLRHPLLRVFTEPTDAADLDPNAETAIANTVAVLSRADFTCKDLSRVSQHMRQRLVAADLYQLSATNLHIVLGDTPAAPADPEGVDDDGGERAGVGASPQVVSSGSLSLDRLRVENDDLYRDALAAPAVYLAIVESDPATTTAISDASAFIDILNDLADWDTDHLATALQSTPVEWHIDVLDSAKMAAATWPALARCGRFPLTLANYVNYVKAYSGIDADLAVRLATARTFTEAAVPVAKATDDETDTDAEAVTDDTVYLSAAEQVATQILNARDKLSDPAVRVGLAASLNPGPLAVATLTPEPGKFLGLLLAADLVTESAETFERFSPMDSGTLTYAAERSEHMATFITPRWMSGDLLALLNSDNVSAATHEAVLTRFDEFIADKPAELLAASRRALQRNVTLTAATIARVAAWTKNATVVAQLLNAAADDLTDAEVVAALVATGGELSNLATSRASFSIEHDSDLYVTLRRLHDAELIMLNRRKGMSVRVA